MTPQYPSKFCVWCCQPGHNSHACKMPRPAPQKPVAPHAKPEVSKPRSA